MKEGADVAIGGDLRRSTERIMEATAVGALLAGSRVDCLGRQPTPLIANYCLRKNKTGQVVTGSHIPLGENGKKDYRSNGELLKEEEKNAKQAYGDRQRSLNAVSPADDMFDIGGMFKTEGLRPEDAERLDAAKKAINDTRNAKDAEALYIDRYVSALGNCLEGTEPIIFWQHSAVGREIVPDILKRLGADVISVEPLDLSKDEFLSLDTEDVKEEYLVGERKIRVRDIMERYNRKIVVTTDGDSDRPAVFYMAEDGRIVYITGDKLGVLTALFLKPEYFAIPITAIEPAVQKIKDAGAEVEFTDVGSPYIVKAMHVYGKDIKDRDVKVAGCEVNGGFLIGGRLFRLPDPTVEKIRKFNSTSKSPLPEPRGEFEALPTRDAVLPIISTLLLAKIEGKGLADLVRDTFSDEKYRAESKMGLVENVSEKQCTPGCENYKKEMK